MRKLQATAASLTLFATASLALAQNAAFGPEFQVNTTTTSYQYGVSIANIGPSCNFVVIWDSKGQDGSATGIVGRLFDASGAPVGGEFPVNVTTTETQGLASVASNAAGNFVVTWTDGTVGNAGTYEVRARRFDASGAP